MLRTAKLLETNYAPFSICRPFSHRTAAYQCAVTKSLASLGQTVRLFMTTWSDKLGVEELDLPDPKHLWEALECKLQARSSHPTLAPDLTNMLFWMNEHNRNPNKIQQPVL